VSRVEPFVLMRRPKGMRVRLEIVRVDSGYWYVQGWGGSWVLRGPSAEKRVQAIRKWNRLVERLQGPGGK
jgi:hypothetical protein